MRILNVITSLGLGGAERQLSVLAPMLVERGHEVMVVSLLSGGDYADQLRARGVEVHGLDIRGPIGGLAGLWRLAGLMRSFAPDVIQTWLYHADLFGLAARALSGCRVRPRLYWGVRCSNAEVAGLGWKHRLIVRVCARLSGRPDGVIANAEAGRDFHFGIGYRARRFEIVPNGIDHERFRPDPVARTEVRAELGIAEDEIVAVLVGRNDPTKGLSVFLEAFGGLDGVRAMLVGNGTGQLPDMPRLLRLGARNDVPRLLAAADLIVSSSLTEGFPNVIAEGMATGLPVVATDVGDTACIVADCGVVVPPDDSSALRDALAQVALGMSAEERRALGAAARRRVMENYRADLAVRRFEAIYQGEG